METTCSALEQGDPVCWTSAYLAVDSYKVISSLYADLPARDDTAMAPISGAISFVLARNISDEMSDAGGSVSVVTSISSR